MKYLSDLDRTTDGRFAIEWEWAEGGRWWEVFDTEAERDEALNRYDAYVAANRDEYLEDRRNEVIRSLELHLDMIDDEMGYLLTDREIAIALRYREWNIKRYTRKSEGFAIAELLN